MRQPVLFWSSAAILAIAAPALAQPRAIAVTPASTEFRALDAQVDQMIRGRALVLRESPRDADLPDRRHERFDQFVRGVRIIGGELTRQSASSGTISLFGTIHQDVPIDTTPGLSVDEASQSIAAAAAGVPFGAPPELVVLPLADGYHLAYFGQAAAGLDISNVFVDAGTGSVLRRYSDFERQSMVGKGTGTYGDLKKVSATSQSGVFVTDDVLRPAEITTYDMKGNLSRLEAILNRQVSVVAADVAADDDNTWTDPTVVDAHVYAGYYYDYLFKRFGRHGIDDRNLRIAAYTHPVRLADIGSASVDVVDQYYLNAFFCSTCNTDGRGAVVFGEGAPKNFFPGFEVKSFAASFDVVAHELTHAVTASTSRLNGFPFSEAGALNEGFSDIFGASAAFFQLPPGSGPLNSSYELGRALTVPAGGLSRSLSSPLTRGDADHYTQRIIGGDPHYNSTIVSHAFYLAIEGGRDLVSGLAVTGVGAANREQIEKSFFRALTLLLPSSATFALTRDASIQAARDLYGSGGTVERAITQAWDAVGVQDRTTPSVALLPNPATGSATASCNGVVPSWTLGTTLSAGTSSLKITQWTWDFFDHAGALQEHDVLTPTTFAQFFNACGPASSSLLAENDACSVVCVNLRGDTSGATQMTFTVTDDAGHAIAVIAPRITLKAPQ